MRVTASELNINTASYTSMESSASEARVARSGKKFSPLYIDWFGAPYLRAAASEKEKASRQRYRTIIADDDDDVS